MNKYPKAIKAYRGVVAMGDEMSIEKKLKDFRKQLSISRSALASATAEADRGAIGPFVDVILARAAGAVSPIAGLLFAADSLIKAGRDLAAKTKNPDGDDGADLAVLAFIASVGSFLPVLGDLFDLISLPIDVLKENDRLRNSLRLAQHAVEALEIEEKKLLFSLGSFQKGVFMDIKV